MAWEVSLELWSFKGVFFFQHTCEMLFLAVCKLGSDWESSPSPCCDVCPPNTWCIGWWAAGPGHLQGPAQPQVSVWAHTLFRNLRAS